MIDPGAIQELLDHEPFEPFRIQMADGMSYEVSHSDLAVTMEQYLFLAMPKRDRFKLLSYELMTSLDVGEIAN